MPMLNKVWAFLFVSVITNIFFYYNYLSSKIILLCQHSIL